MKKKKTYFSCTFNTFPQREVNKDENQEDAYSEGWFDRPHVIQTIRQVLLKNFPPVKND